LAISLRNHVSLQRRLDERRWLCRKLGQPAVLDHLRHPSGIESDDFQLLRLGTDLWTPSIPWEIRASRWWAPEPSGAALAFPSRSGRADLWRTGNRAPRVIQPAQNTDFEICREVRFLPARQYQIQGILAQQDARNSSASTSTMTRDPLPLFASPGQ